MAGSGGAGGFDAGAPLVLAPPSLLFRACPTHTDAGVPVAGATAALADLTVTNPGLSSAALAPAVSGDDAGAFALVVPAPTSLSAGGSTSVRLAFAPPRPGAYRATFEVASGGARATLLGEGLGLLATPTLESAVEAPLDGGYRTCSAGASASSCTVEFPDTFSGEASTMTVKLRNQGCPPLAVSDLAIEGVDAVDFALVQPAVAPSVARPLVLDPVLGTEEQVLVLRFSPRVDPAASRAATLVITSNDPVVGGGTAAPARLSLTGNAFGQGLSVSPLSCAFSDLADLCGNTAKIAGSARFLAANGSSVNLTLSLRFASSGTNQSSSGRFGYTLTPAVVGPGGTATLTVTATSLPGWVTDTLVLTALAPSGVQGVARLSLSSGTPPCMTTSPADEVSFPGVDGGTSLVRVANGAGCGALTLSQVVVDPSPFFSLTAPFVAPGTVVPADGGVTFGVSYRPPLSGGTQRGLLHVESDDPRFSTGKVLQLQGGGVFDELPTAVLRACPPSALLTDPLCAAGATSSLGVSYAALSPKLVTLSGVGSSDPDPAMPGATRAVSAWKFSLVTMPAGATTAALANHGVRLTSPTTTLTLPAGVTGAFRVSLVVYDSAGQASPATLLTVNVAP